MEEGLSYNFKIIFIFYFLLFGRDTQTNTMVEKKKESAIINKMIKKINKVGDAYEIKSLIVQAETINEAETAFNKEWEREN